MCRLLYLAALLLQTITVSRTKFWKRKLSLPTDGYTFQITLNVLKQTPENLAAERGLRAVEESGSREGRLIET